MNEIILPGCTPTPLASYLKALGVFRLVAEQKDPEAKARWQGERFVLVTQLSREETTRFFLEEYRPTPILAPWNGGSGFYPKDNQEALNTIRASESSRFHDVRQSIEVADKALKRMGLSEKPSGEAEKDKLLALLRAELPDNALTWFDAAVLLTASGRRHPPLLGKGGIEGRLEFSNNYLQKLLAVLNGMDGKQTPQSMPWIMASLYSGACPQITKGSPGMLLPFSSGGPNAGNGFEVDSKATALVNPWDYVLMVEGAVVFAASSSRRLESADHAGLSYPFTVKATGAGVGSVCQADSNQVQNEIWLPLWHQPISFVELRNLFGEGRVTIGRKPVSDGLDFSRAVASLGVARGIDSFQRTGFLERRAPGQGYYVTAPLGRFNVRRSIEVDLITDLDHDLFLDCLRQFARRQLPSGEYVAPASLKRAVSQLENALFALTQPGAGHAHIQRALILLGEVMQVLAASRKGREAVPMLPRLSAAWVMQAADDTAEFRIALALASLQELRPYLSPVERHKGWWQWAPESRRHVWGKGDLVRNLIRVIGRRLMESQRNTDQKPFQSQARLGARLSDVDVLLGGQADDGLIAALLQGLIWAELPDELPHAADTNLGHQVATPTMPYAICKPFFTDPALLEFLGRLPKGASFDFPGELPRLLAAGQLDKALTLAWRRGQITGLGWPQGKAPQAPSLDGQRLLAALAVPLQPAALLQLLPRSEDLQTEPT